MWCCCQVAFGLLHIGTERRRPPVEGSRGRTPGCGRDWGNSCEFDLKSWIFLMSNVFVCLFVSLLFSSWTEGDAGGSGSQTLVLLSNHFACFVFLPSDSQLATVSTRWRSTTTTGSLLRLPLPLSCRPSVLSPPGGGDTRSMVLLITDEWTHKQNIFQTGFFLTVVIFALFEGWTALCLLSRLQGALFSKAPWRENDSLPWGALRVLCVSFSIGGMSTAAVAAGPDAVLGCRGTCDGSTAEPEPNQTRRSKTARLFASVFLPFQGFVYWRMCEDGTGGCSCVSRNWSLYKVYVYI